ncbi:MAG: hypothetical protein AAGB04_01440 [Pseudomonadota bacterium]
MPGHKWIFKSRFRANAYGWKATALATKRLKEAVSEIKKVSKSNPVTGAEGAVSLMERIWPSLQGIDGSSGSLGNAVNRTLEALIPLVIDAPADNKTRSKWLERLFEAVQVDGVNYLSPVEDRWGELCGGDELAKEWVNRLLPIVEEFWTQENVFGSWVHGQSICLSCLLATKRFEELQQLLSKKSHQFWAFDKFWAQALAEQGEVDAAVEFAESCRSRLGSYDDPSIVAFCEQTLVDAGRASEAYQTYAMQSSQATTHLATFRQIARRYPELDSREILQDLIRTHPPKGKWFAAAKHADCLEVALECADYISAEPNTLIRAARDFLSKEPSFAAEVALCAIKNLLAGGGYEPTRLDVMQAHQHLIDSASACGREEWADEGLEQLIVAGAVRGREEFLEALVLERTRAAQNR